MPELSGCVSKPPFGSSYRVGGPRIGTSSMKGMVVSGISGWRMWVTSSWKIGTEFVHPMGRVTSRWAPNGVWNVVKSRDDSASPRSS
ncbi:hypothetical protein HETIRDRAFT_310108 [Heterobasidion irregulare TC 32-1]|uniref:Uncharacterized protein n=1 Tax=Heterobasidion irregulare (strain TC 32-1) TaxID=747525 RepID=W4KJ16_HETIT|nr:uncharacterized protein HETIRDRAFT_310108 [Heterobasidion irregulare TC 32-1]ETW85295.1 hypothetical protein HETIRDRAFT_310108 [Heterobasidion irregulare TC 32-1]